MNLENQISSIIGKRWYVKKNPKIFLENKDIIRRAHKIKNPLCALSKYNPKKELKAQPLILDNLYGSIQHYLLGYDLSSIHQSSKSMEIGLLYKIRLPMHNEIRRSTSFSGILKIVQNRGDLNSESSVEAANRVLIRRNIFTHDAILQQTISKVEEDYFKEKMKDNPEYLNIFMKIFKNKFNNLHSLPDVSWYVNDRTLNSSINFIENFLEENIAKDLTPLYENESVSIVDRIKSFSNLAQSILKNEYDLIRHSAFSNINDVYLVLHELYTQDFFNVR